MSLTKKDRDWIFNALWCVVFACNGSTYQFSQREQELADINKPKKKRKARNAPEGK